MPERAVSQLMKMMERLELIKSELSQLTAVAESAQSPESNAAAHFDAARKAANHLASKAALLAHEALLLSMQLEDASKRLRSVH